VCHTYNERSRIRGACFSKAENVLKRFFIYNI